MSIEVNFESLKSIGKGSTCAIYPYDDGRVIKKYYPQFLKGRYAELQSFIKDMIKVRSNADAKMRDFVDRLFTWPLDIVTENGEFCGFIMNRIPDEYRWEYTSNGKRRECSLDLELAYSGADNLRKKGLSLPDRNGRAIISQWLIIAVRLMHLSHITMRDISSKNVFVRFDPIDQRNSKVLFVDVDSYCGYRVAGLKNPLDTSETPGWRTPDADEPVSPSKDIFKICLAIARLYQTGKVTTLDISGTKREYESKLKEYYGEAFERISMEVSPAFAECVKRGLSYNAGDRPDADELLSVLQSSLQTEPTGKDTSALKNSTRRFDVFICCMGVYKDLMIPGDRFDAYRIYKELTKKGIKVFWPGLRPAHIATRPTDKDITAALNSAKLMLVIGKNRDCLDATKNLWKKYIDCANEEKTLLFASSTWDDHENIDAVESLKKTCSVSEMAVFSYYYSEWRELIHTIEKIIDCNIEKTIKESGFDINSIDDKEYDFIKRLHKTKLKELGTIATIKTILLSKYRSKLMSENWRFADKILDMLLEHDPEDPDAYLGKLMVQLKVRKRTELKYQDEPFASNEYYQKVMKYGDTVIKNELELYIALINARKITALQRESSHLTASKDRFIINGLTKAQMEEEAKKKYNS